MGLTAMPTAVAICSKSECLYRLTSARSGIIGTPHIERPRTARFSLSITDLKGISFHRRKHEQARANTREANPNFDRVNIQTFSTESAQTRNFTSHHAFL